MEVTSVVNSVRFLHLQTRFSSQFERHNNNNNGSLLVSAQINAFTHYHHHQQQLHPINQLLSSKMNGSNNSKSVIIKSTSSSTSIETSETLTEVERIKQSCLKWKWKGQYSINYFVSADSPKPPLLLVHGFGASIPHWRRYVSFFPL